MQDNKGFIFKLSVITKPSIPKEILDIYKEIFFIVGRGEETKIGYVDNNCFIEIDENEFLQGLINNVLQVLMIEGNTGSFKQG